MSRDAKKANPDRSSCLIQLKNYLTGRLPSQLHLVRNYAVVNGVGYVLLINATRDVL